MDLHLQVHDFLYEAYMVDEIRKPRVLGYDDACHLKKFMLLRKDSSSFVKWLFTVDPDTGHMFDIRCDRFHFRNHTSEWCKANVDPAKCKVPGFEKVNTSAAEEAFSFLSGAKHTMRHMNAARFNFFALRLMHLRNLQLFESLCQECEA